MRITQAMCRGDKGTAWFTLAIAAFFYVFWIFDDDLKVEVAYFAFLILSRIEFAALRIEELHRSQMVMHKLTAYRGQP